MPFDMTPQETHEFVKTLTPRPAPSNMKEILQDYIRKANAVPDDTDHCCAACLDIRVEQGCGSVSYSTENGQIRVWSDGKTVFVFDKAQIYDRGYTRYTLP